MANSRLTPDERDVIIAISQGIIHVMDAIAELRDAIPNDEARKRIDIDLDKAFNRMNEAADLMEKIVKSDG
ncbi:hypothetical protein [Massilia sp. METH4]|uniref:hypothetical protein n=1 Tax=Massilia sp. METH4 TaxID=3123041 RepID=UPI0030D60126